MPSRRPKPPAAKPELITLDAAGEILGMHPRTVRRFIAEGKVRGYRIGDRAIRVRRSDIEALLQRVPVGWGD